MQKLFALAEVKDVPGAATAAGEFEVILSMPTLDRDGEVIDAKAFEPLPESIPFHAFHNFSDPIARAVPRYEGDVLKATGYYASTPRAQEIRALVAEGVIAHTSVGFMPPIREVKDGIPHITKGELLEGSFVSVPSNREAAVVGAKVYRPDEPEAKSIEGSYEARRDSFREALVAANPEAWFTFVVATFDDAVVYGVETHEGITEYRAPYTIGEDGEVTLGAAEEVEVTEVVTPKNPTATDPEKSAASAADTPALVPVGRARLAALRAEGDLLLID